MTPFTQSPLSEVVAPVAVPLRTKRPSDRLGDIPPAAVAGNILANGTFAGNSATGWTGLGTGGKSVVNNRLTFEQAVENAAASAALTLVDTTAYSIKFDLVLGQGSMRVRLAGGAGVDGTERTASGTYTESLTAVTGSNALEVVATDDAGPNSFYVDNISVVPV